MDPYKNQRILILGMGRSGRSLLHFFSKRGAICSGFDDSGVKSESSCPVYKSVRDVDFNKFDLIATSPGISPQHQVYQIAKEKSIRVKGEIQIGLESIENTKVAVTGTNGKSTVTALVSHLLNHAGKTARPVGNIGVPITSIVDRIDPAEIVVVELSSYQIDQLNSKCVDLALLLNISPDHLDRYGSLKAYADSKFSLKNYIKNSAPLITSRTLVNPWGAHILNCEFFDQKFRDFQKAYGPLYDFISPFEEQNYSAALAIVERFNLSTSEIREGLKTFKGLSHRCEYVRKVKGVDFYNDSKATNVESVMKAVSSFNAPIYLIMGGDDKELDYSPLKPYFLEKVKELHFIGQAKEKMAKVFEKDYSVSLYSSLDQAVRGAYKKSQTKEIVLLSPGTSSFDMFNSFEHRGDEFKRIVKQIEEEDS